MAKLPEPPPAGGLPPLRSEDERVLPAGTPIWRIYHRGGPHPVAWAAFRAYGPVDARFDHHEEPARQQRRKILYGAPSPDGIATCVVETFQATRVIDRLRHEPWLVGARLVRDLRLLDLTGDWPTRAGASQAINSGPRSRARRWSRRIYDDYRSIAGLYYCSSMNGNRPAIALYERATNAFPARPRFNRPLLDAYVGAALRQIAGRFDWDVVPP